MTKPFVTETYVVDGHTIVVESYRDGEVDASRQRNGSGPYNAKRYTRWLVTANGIQRELRSRFGYSKWEAYETVRQAVARTEDAVPLRRLPSGGSYGFTRSGRTVQDEMKAALVLKNRSKIR